MIPLPPRIYAYAAVAVVIAGLALALKVQSNRLETMQLKYSAANSENKSNLVTINAQANALDEWKKLGFTYEQMAIFVANAKERERAYNAVFSENKMLKEKDRALPDCVKLLQTSLKLCPGRYVSLRNAAAGNNAGPGAGASH